jgi:hypothetical protein
LQPPPCANLVAQCQFDCLEVHPPTIAVWTQYCLDTKMLNYNYCMDAP